ncbi:MAG: outer rane transport energization protein TonB [Acidobacteriaceae bacterium]|nr:outer rane transport energization protein TonB [Acidobacteriaceae bacterium]
MSPRSLLFSSNEETSRQIGQALIELDFQVDSCREIFAALEKLTTRRYEVVVADCQDGAETAFLLKTARELKCNQSAFTIALGDFGGLAGDVTGAAHVLRRPFVCERVKYDLLTCDAFLGNMRTWFSRGEPEINQTAGAAVEAIRKRLITSTIQEDAAKIARTAGPSSNLTSQPAFRESAPYNPLEDVDANLPSQSDIQTLFATANAEAQSSTKNGPLIPIVLCIGLGAALLFTDYVFDDKPLWGKLVSASSNVALNLKTKAEALVRGSGRNREQKEARVSELPQTKATKRARRNDAGISVTEIRTNENRASIQDIFLTATEPARQQEELPSDTAGKFSSQPSPSLAASLFSTSSSVPDSLNDGSRSAVPERDLPTGAPSRLDRALLPVNLTTDLADELLLERTRPSYPQRALQAGLQGSVVLQALIGTDGVIRDLKLLSGPMLLGKAACEAVKQWRYKPYLLNGRLVEAQTLVTVDFKLPTKTPSVLSR